MGLSILITALVAALLLQGAQSQMSWRTCEGVQELPAQAFDVALSPDPPVIGSPATFTVKAHSSAEVASGTVDITISFLGIEIYSKSEDLCSLTTCPMQPGEVVIVLVEDLPPIAPPGDYGLLLEARDSQGTEVICLNVDFELVLPGALSTSAGTAVTTGRATESKWKKSALLRGGIVA